MMFFNVSRRSVLRSTKLWKSHENCRIHINNLCTFRTIRNHSTCQQSEDAFIEEEPEPPESGKRLFRDGIMIGLIAILGAWSWTLYKQKRENYDSNTLSEIYSVKAHIEHAFNTKDIDLRTYHLSEAETHCRKALNKVDSNDNDYDPQIISLHIQLGKICYLLHKYQSAIDNYLIVLKALTQEFGYKSNELIMPCRQISDCYMNLGQYQMSLLFLERILKIIENDTTNKEYAPIYQQIAVLLRKQYKWKESIEYTNKAIKGAKSLLGENHIQISDMLLGRACCEMELKQWENAEMTARNALKILEYETNQYSSPVNKYNIISNENERHNKIIDGGIKNTLKNKLKNDLMGVEKTEQQIKYEQQLKLEKQKQQMNINNTISGVYFVEQLIEMKCSILYVIGQSLIEQDRLNEAQIILNNALKYAIDLSDNTKQLLIHDQLRDIETLISTNQ